MRRELFFVVLIIIGLLLWQYSINTTESFQDFVMPKPNPQPTPVAKGDPLPFAPSSTALLAPPPGQTASVNSYPADDPAQKKANIKRINNTLETLNGFLKNEASGLSKLGDPAVQIPLQTAQADARRLTDEVSVIKRNPGVESTLSDENVNDIDANLTYLQKKWRLSVNSMSGAVEGFQSGPSGSLSGPPSGPPSSSTYNYKGIIPDFPSLPSSGNTTNDYYIINLDFNVFLWNIYALWDGSAWRLQGFPTFSVVDTVRDITELSNMNYDDFIEGGVYKIFNKVGPYTVYLAWMGGAPGPANAPQDIINMMNYVYNQPNNGAYGPNDIKTGSGRHGRFRFIATTSSSNINTLIHDIAKTPNFIGTDKGAVRSISELPLSNNVNNDNLLINADSNIPLYATWRGNCWVGDIRVNSQTAVKVEPFQNLSGSASNIIGTPELIAYLTKLLRTASPSGQPSGQPSGPSPSGKPSGLITEASTKITLDQLKLLQTNILATITRLTASGSTNPLLTQRVNVLETILHNIDSYITQVSKGTLKISDVPITLDQYMKFLPFIDPTKSLNVNEPLPNLIRQTGASSALMNLFPYFMNGDISGADLARELFDKYAKDLFSETSYDINLKFNHKSESERRIAETVAKAMLNPIIRPFADNNGEGGYGNAPYSSGSRGETEKKMTTMSGSTDGKTTTKNDKNIGDTTNISTVPAVLDWKARSQQICDQISKRGLDPNDYGCLKNTKEVDANFSFRGYARMICSRLGTNYDPSIPDLCGCPPPTWAGWRP